MATLYVKKVKSHCNLCLLFYFFALLFSYVLIQYIRIFPQRNRTSNQSLQMELEVRVEKKFVITLVMNMYDSMCKWQENFPMEYYVLSVLFLPRQRNLHFEKRKRTKLKII